MVEDPPTAFTASLSSFRTQLDALDSELVTLLARRFSITAQIGELKAVHGAPAEDRAREEAQLSRLVGLSAEQGLRSEVTRAVFETLFALVRNHHQTIASAPAGERK